MEDRKLDDTDLDDDRMTFTDDFMDDQQQAFPNMDELDESNMPILGANIDSRMKLLKNYLFFIHYNIIN